MRTNSTIGKAVALLFVIGLGGWAYQSQLSAFVVTQLNMGAGGYGLILTLNGLGACTAALLVAAKGAASSVSEHSTSARAYSASSSLFSVSCTVLFGAGFFLFVRRVRHHSVFLHRQQHHTDAVSRSVERTAHGDLGDRAAEEGCRSGVSGWVSWPRILLRAFHFRWEVSSACWSFNRLSHIQATGSITPDSLPKICQSGLAQNHWKKYAGEFGVGRIFGNVIWRTASVVA